MSSCEVRKTSSSTHVAICSGGRLVYLPQFAGPKVHRRDACLKVVPTENLQRNTYLKRSDCGRYRIDHSGGFASGLDPGGRLWIQTRKTACRPWHDGHSDAVATDRSAVYPGNPVLHGEFVDEITRFKIVGAVKN